MCCICDGFEAIDQRIAIIGDGAMAEREAEFLRNYSYRVTVLDNGQSSGTRKRPPTGTDGLERININLSQLEIKKNRVTLASATGERYFDVAYLALGSTPQHGLARSLGAQCDERDALTVNAPENADASDRRMRLSMTPFADSPSHPPRS